ncbi:hypothetical protein E1292_34080 [Nonomuraea deserti]|uniref:Uncharacterized protein n=1 Tax=Nonomuraea deserti TaxID=1848322 RepID=A0A4R4V122_9ACTN|nr:hypothetical protein [Nonomuraea deserti]TDC98768.1 hypothetical protein E1292_34080 [Nonomuraea deserti]
MDTTTCWIAAGDRQGWCWGCCWPGRAPRDGAGEAGDFLRDFRGDTVHPTTLELLDELGLGDRFERLPQNRLDEVLAPVGGGIQRVGDLAPPGR